MPPVSIRTSPNSISDVQFGHSKGSIATLSASTNIPSTSDLTTLVGSLKERNRVLVRRRRNLRNDQTALLTDSTEKRQLEKVSLASVLAGSPSGVSIDSAIRISPGLDKLTSPSTNKKRNESLANTLTPLDNKSQAPPISLGESSASAHNGAGRPKIKIKRDPDRDRERSESLAANESTSGSLSFDKTSTQARLDSPSVDVDWDEDDTSKSFKIKQIKRKRQRLSQTRDIDDVSLSDFGSPQPGSSQIASPSRRERDKTACHGISASGLNGSSTSSSTAGIKLRLNPTTHTAPIRKDSLVGPHRRQSLIRTRDELPALQSAAQLALWQLPQHTPDTFIPKEPVKRITRSHPTKADDVDVDFAKMDWRERDRERDRLEAATATAAGTGPGPGQAVVKESAAASRAKDRKQDQVAHHTFQQWADGWFRTLTDEDLAWLSSKTDDLDVFQIPRLGRHYSEVWEEEEAKGMLIPTTYLSRTPATATTSLTAIPPSIAQVPMTATAAPRINGSASHIASADLASTSGQHDIGDTPKFDPKTLNNDHVSGSANDDARAGPFTERLLAAVLPTATTAVRDGSTAIDNATQGTPRPSSSQHSHGGHGSESGKSQDMSTFEARLREELKAVDILGDQEIDWSDRADDEISSTLRKVQKLLRTQMRLNQARKSRLFAIAMDRMAYQEYLGCLNSVEREIESGWMRRQTQIKKSMQAQKKKKGSSNSSNTAATATSQAVNGIINGESHGVGSPGHNLSSSAMAHSSSSLGVNASHERSGGGPIKPQFTDALLSAIEKRKQLKFALEPLFAEKPLAKYTPQGMDSVFKDIDV